MIRVVGFLFALISLHTLLLLSFNERSRNKEILGNTQ